MTDQPGRDDVDDAGELGRTLEAARRAAPALTPRRTQQWRWAVLSRVDGRGRRPTPAIAVACAAAVILAIVGWRQLRPAHDQAASRPQLRPPSGPGVQTLADGTRVVPDGPTTVIEKAIESDDDVLYEL